MLRNSSIIVRTAFEALHYWEDAPDEVVFLQSPHRHIFHVRLQIQVYHFDRELEFILVRRALEAFIHQLVVKPLTPVKMSCEMYAEAILAWAAQTYNGKTPMMTRSMVCEVSEDGENGAVVEHEYAP